MKRLSDHDILHLFHHLSDRFDLVVPVTRPDGTRVFGSPGDGTLSLTGPPPAGKPFSTLFPPTDPLLLLQEGEWLTPPPPVRPLLLAGLLPADRRALLFIDRFFGRGYGDERYHARRKGSVIVGIAGRVGESGGWVEPTGDGCELELIREDEGWLAAPLTPWGDEVVGGYAEGELTITPPLSVDDPLPLIEEASRILRESDPDPLWEEIAQRCIGCGGCTQVCPTCTCYGVSDRVTGSRGERLRIWDSCQLSGFMREGGGHNPLGKGSERSRRRIHHKLVDDPVRWGELGCVGCGRCDRHCPTGIGMLAVCRRIVSGGWGA